MNNVFTTKLLNNLRNKKGNKGFTLIELLVVVIIIGVLAAVALPNLLSQVGKARETEMKNTTGTINRSQQAYHFERQVFSDDTAKLGVTIQNQYIDDVDLAITANAGDDATFVPVNAESANDGTRAYSGAVYHVSGAYTTLMCQSNEVANSIAAPAATDTTTCDGTNGVIVK